MYPGVAMRVLGAERGVVGRGAKSISCKELGDLVVGELCCGIGGHMSLWMLSQQRLTLSKEVRTPTEKNHLRYGV